MATTASTDHPLARRLYFLDWIRITAFFLLILYHTGMYYVSWDFHIKSPFAGDAIEPLMMLSSPWRLGLLFMVSGVASAFLLAKLTTRDEPDGAHHAAFLRQRSARLLVPLLFGMLVVVPPQSYCEVVEKLGYQGGYLDFMKLYLAGYHGFCKGQSCLDLPTWNHLWFVAYLWVYTLVLAGLTAILGARWQRLSAWLGRRLSGWQLVVLPAAVLAVARLALFSRYPSTHNLVVDWYNHAVYLPLFLFGALLGAAHGGKRTQAAPEHRPTIWQRMETLRFPALGIALGCWAMLMAYYALTEKLNPDDIMPLIQVQRAVYALLQWSAMLAVFGFGHRHLQFDSPKRRYLSQAVFPVYIVHQTLIIVFAHVMQPARMAPATEGLVLVVLTVTFSFGIVEAVRRVPLLRACFGIGGGVRQAAISRTSAYVPSDPAGKASPCR